MSAIWNEGATPTSWESGWIGTDVQITDIPTDVILAPQPAPSVWADPSSGITLGGVLTGITATASSLGDVFGKFYNIQNNAANQKFAQEVTRANLDLQKTQVLGGLDVAKARTEAENKIELARAQLGVPNAIAQMQSPGALRIGSTAIPQNVWVAAAIAFGFYMFSRKKKA